MMNALVAAFLMVRVLSIGDSNTWNFHGPDDPTGAWYWIHWNRPGVVSRGAGAAGFPLVTWGYPLGETPARIGPQPNLWQTMAAREPWDVIVTSLGAHDLRLEITPEEFGEALLGLEAKLPSVRARALVHIIVTRAPISPEWLERARLHEELMLERCAAELWIFCTDKIDLLDHPEWFGPRLHLNGEGQEAVAELASPTVLEAIRYVRRLRYERDSR